MSFVNVVCINSGNYQGEGIKYVNLLHDMVRRNLPKTVEGKFICYVDDADWIEDLSGYTANTEVRRLPIGLKGWWAKLWLFQQGQFPEGERVLYFDLDVCITGALDDLAAYNGEFATLTDFYQPTIYNSSVMAWRAGFGQHIWDGWVKVGKPEVAGGDQVVIWHQHRTADRLQELFPGAFVSYKQSARLHIPDGCKVVVFHGHPKPGSIKDGWVPRVWTEGGISLFDLKLSGNVESSQVLLNIRYALKSKIPFIGLPVAAHERAAVIVGGGPSLNSPDIIEEIRSRWQAGAAVIALNNSWRWLQEHQIYGDYHVLLDARDGNGVYVPPEVNTMQRLYSAQCSRMVLDNAPPRKTKLWFPYYPDVPELLKAEGVEGAFFGGGSTVGMCVLSLLHYLGFREFHLFGYDSSYADDAHHAYKQPDNDGETKITVDYEGRKYISTPWMVAQVQEFQELAAVLVNDGEAEIHVPGTGLLPAVARTMAESLPPGSVVKRGGIWWPSADTQASNIILQELLDLPKIMEHVTRTSFCVQAGGNVGLWPREFAKIFEHVWTFEPDETNFKCMYLNVPENPKITRFKAGLWDTDTRADMERDTDNCGAYFVKPVADDVTDYGEIALMTVDSLDLPGCDLLQLDIEGAEHSALVGAKSTIEKFHPVIVVESKGLGDRFGNPADAVPCLLNALGYIFAANIGRDVVYTWQPTNGVTPNE